MAIFWFSTHCTLEVQENYLLELVNSENAPCITAVGSDLLTEAGRQSCVPDWKSRLGQPFPPVVGCNGLLRSGDQVLFFCILVSNLFTAFADDLNIFSNSYNILDHTASKLPCTAHRQTGKAEQPLASLLYA